MKFKIFSKLHLFSLVIFVLLNICQASDLYAQKLNAEFGGALNFSFYKTTDEWFSSNPLDVDQAKPYLGSSIFGKVELQVLEQLSVASGLEIALLGAKENIFNEQEWGGYLTIPLELRLRMDKKSKMIGGIAYQYALLYYYRTQETQFLLNDRKYWNLLIGYQRTIKNKWAFQITYHSALNDLYTINFTDLNGNLIGSRSVSNRYIQLAFLYKLPIDKKSANQE